jgi:hypothetical protein
VRGLEQLRERRSLSTRVDLQALAESVMAASKVATSSQPRRKTSALCARP